MHVTRPARPSSHVSRLHLQLCDIEKFVDELKVVGVEFFAGVPDSLLKSCCAYVTDTCGESHVISMNERWFCANFAQNL